jgi:hypothetical protein
MRWRALISLCFLGFSGCGLVQDPVTAKIDRAAVFEFGSYCAVPPDAGRSALSYAETGFAYVEQQCGIFFDNLSALTQAGRFSIKALNATSLGTQTILQAAKVAATNVTIVGAAFTLTEAVFNAFVEQYAFAPYLYKMRELTWQTFNKHTTDNGAKLATLANVGTSDAYCSAFVLIQQHASICTLSYVQMLFDQQVANPTLVVDAGVDKPKVTKNAFVQQQSLVFGRSAAPRSVTILPAAPNYTIR